MDIDTETPIDSNSQFSIVLPLPYRCLLLVCIGILGWATNLHGLYFLGVDTGYALDIRRSGSMDNGYENLTASSSRMNRGTATFAHPSSLYRPIYKIFITYGALIVTSWLLFRLLSGDETDSSKIIPSLTFLAVLVSLFWPFPFSQKQERYTFLRYANVCRWFH
jgi:EXS family